MNERIRRINVCPKCGETYSGVPAMSRIAPYGPICPDCGTREALDSIGVSKEEQELIIAKIHETNIHI